MATYQKWPLSGGVLGPFSFSILLICSFFRGSRICNNFFNFDLKKNDFWCYNVFPSFVFLSKHSTFLSQIYWEKCSTFFSATFLFLLCLVLCYCARSYFPAHRVTDSSVISWWQSVWKAARCLKSEKLTFWEKSFLIYQPEDEDCCLNHKAL